MKFLLTLLPILALVAVSQAATAQSFSNQRLPSGVNVVHTQVGKGAMPVAGDTVTVNYRGILENGVEFDSSYKRGEPISFPLGNVIQCWQEGVQQMHIGGKASLACPAATAYGPYGIPGVIPPNAPLKFDVELLGIKSK